MNRMTTLGVTALTILTAACDDPVVAPLSPEEGDALAVASSHTGRAFLPGEQQPVADLGRGFTYAIYPEGQGQNLTQTFSPTRNGKLGFVELPVACSNTVLLKIRIRDGIAGPILSDFNSVAPGPLDGSFELFQVFDPASSHGIRIRKNRTYAIELSAVPTNPNVATTCGLVPGPAGDSYTRGDGYFEDLPTNGPGWNPLGGGEDLPFITLVN